MKKKLESLQEFLTTATRGRTITFLIVILLVATLPVVIRAVQTNTENRQHAMIIGGGGSGCTPATVATDCPAPASYCSGHQLYTYTTQCTSTGTCSATSHAGNYIWQCGATCQEIGDCSSTQCAQNHGTCYPSSACPSNLMTQLSYSCGANGPEACCIVAPTPTPTPDVSACTNMQGFCAESTSFCDSNHAVVSGLCPGIEPYCCVPRATPTPTIPPSGGSGGSDTNTGSTPPSSGGPGTNPAPSISPPSGGSGTHTYLNLAVLLPGLGAQGNGNTNFHSGNTRKMTISIYSKDANIHDVTTQPLIAPLQNIVITYNTNNGFFTNTSIDLGTGLSDNEYQVLVKVPQFLRQRIITTGTTDTTIHLIPGQTISTQVSLVPGDVAPIFNVLDIQDYNALVSCYNKNVTANPACIMEDINDDGQIDLVDLNLFLRGMRTLADLGSTTYQGEGAPGE